MTRKLRRGAQGCDRAGSQCTTLEEVHWPPHEEIQAQEAYNGAQ
jgi:hypothetical protein